MHQNRINYKTDEECMYPLILKFAIYSARRVNSVYF